jgi:hypothetical protein
VWTATQYVTIEQNYILACTLRIERNFCIAFRTSIEQDEQSVVSVLHDQRATTEAAYTTFKNG